MIFKFYVATINLSCNIVNLSPLQLVKFNSIIAEATNGILDLQPYTLWIVDATVEAPFFDRVTSDIEVDLCVIARKVHEYLFNGAKWPQLYIDKDIVICSVLVFCVKKFGHWIAHPNKSNYKYKTVFLNSVHGLASMTDEDRAKISVEWLRVRNNLSYQGQTIVDGFIKRFRRNEPLPDGNVHE